MTALLLLANSLLGAQADRQVIQTFQVEEHFGVSHPLQVIDFDLKHKINRSEVHVVDDKGQPVLFQVIDNGAKVAVQTELRAGESRQWKLLQGRGPKVRPSLVPVTKLKEGTRNYYQITNGITGIRLPTPVTMPSPTYKPLVDLFNYGPNKPRLFLPAPVQGVLYRDGKWSATGPNGMVCLANRLVKMDVRFLEQGPLMVVAEVSYVVDHPEYRAGSIKLRPAGRGFYHSTITIQAGQPSILFEEDTDLEMTWSMNLYPGLHPSNARYRGASAREKKYGYEPDGQALRTRPTRPELDAQVDLRYDRAMTSRFMSTDSSWHWMAVWDRWATDTGWYWQLYDAKAADTANLIGIFTGRASRAVGAGFSGAGIFTLPPRSGATGPVAGISISSYRRSASNDVFPRSRFQWGLFVGTKQDLKDPTEVQPINLQMNLHGGFNLNKVLRYTLDFPDPPGGYGALYMDRKAVEEIKEKLRADKKGPLGRGYYGYLYMADPPSRPLIEMWTDPKGDKLRAAVRKVSKTATDMLRNLVHGEGIQSVHWGYWHGGLAMMQHGIWIDQILADSRTTAEERRQIKAAAVLFANILWDDDYVPLQGKHGLSLGSANMPVQQVGYRRFYALLLAQHPTMTERAKEVEAAVQVTVKRLINEDGAEIGCPHYMAASFAPTLNTLLQVKQRVKDDPFKAEPRLAKFAEFYMHLLTPPEPRVANKRALISLGDSSTEPSEMFGVLGTGFRAANPKLSSRLMGAWDANGKPQSSFFGTTILMIDDSLPGADPRLSDASFPGYFSVLRHGWGSPDETALWFVNGEHYFDHRHNDHGSVVIYALGKPLSIDWGSLYTPYVQSAYMHSGVVLERSIGHAWDKDGPALKGGGRWGESTQEAFAAFEEGAYARAKFKSGNTVWTRSVLSLRADPSHPILVLRDTFAGEQANLPKVLTLNLMATGAVDTPAGKVNPPLRQHPPKDSKAALPDWLPSVSPSFNLPAGVNRLGFSGKFDVDWDVYTINDHPQKALIGNWAVTPWGGHITDKDERQHILRVRGSGPFITVILPWRRGHKPAGLSVSQEGNTIVVRTATDTARIDPAGYSYASKTRTVNRKFAQ
jgi:hypothetical protein